MAEPVPEPVPEPPAVPPRVLAPEFDSGQVSSPTFFEPNPAFREPVTLWRIVFSTDTAPGTDVGLISRDQTGQATGGHFTVWQKADGRIELRFQDVDSGATTLVSADPAIGGLQVVDICVTPADVILRVNGDEQGRAAVRGPSLALNDLPLLVGGRCTTCIGREPVTWPAPYPVNVQIFNECNDVDVLNISGNSVHVYWELPTADTNGDPLTGELTSTIRIGTESGVYTRVIEGIEGESLVISELDPGVTYYLVGTAVTATGVESLFSEEIAFRVIGQ